MSHVVLTVEECFLASVELLPAIVGQITSADGVNLPADRIRAFCGRNRRSAKWGRQRESESDSSARGKSARAMRRRNPSLLFEPDPGARCSRL